MSEPKIITVLGANGQVGREFVKQAGSAGHAVRAFVRRPEGFDNPDPERVTVVQGDATDEAQVASAIDGVQVVASFLGNPHPNPKKILIMQAAADNILTAAAAQPTPPRCLMISSVGVGGSSWLIKLALQMIGGRAQFEDYERAEARIRSETKVPWLIIRPYALTDGPPKGAYSVIEGPTAHFARPIPRPDVARFFLDCVDDRQWDGSGVNVGGAP